MKTIEVEHQDSWGHDLKDRNYSGEWIKVHRACKMRDLEAVYIVRKPILDDGQESGFYDQDFDEYYCNNCENYYVDFGEDHPLPQ